MKAFYFPHDDNAAGDEGVLKLRAKFGNTEGYALWFMLLEYLSRNDGYLVGNPMAELAICYNVPEEKWAAFVAYCVDISLLKQSRNGVFSYRIVEHIGYRKERVESGRKGAQTRWQKQNQSNGTAIAPALAEPMAGEERRGEERKETTKLGVNAKTKEKQQTFKVDDQPPAAIRQQKTAAQTEQEFYEAIQSEGWADQAYADNTMARLRTLKPADREECHRKMRVMMNAYRSPGAQTRKLAHKMYGEVVGLIRDKSPEKRRELT